MRAVGETFRAAGVIAIYLVHGTFVGDDALGFIDKLAGVMPSAAVALRRLQKQALDTLLKDGGNYSSDFAAEFEQAINCEGQRRIPLRLFYWSSENHHIGRAHAAVQLVDELAARHPTAEGRILLWGHSHAGNVFALLTNLLGADRETRYRFFRAARSYYRWPLIGRVDQPVWQRVQSLLDRDTLPLARALDIVTFGTPIRYGWDSSSCARLLHFVNHRPADGRPAFQAAFPPVLDDVLSAAGGDYIQQLGIAGTNFSPDLFAWRAWLAELRLKRLLQGGFRQRNLLARLSAGVRVADEGETLLVDYGPGEGHIGQHIAGHAVYTRLGWLLFHAEQVARRFYG
jgi:hypothetical protein